MTVASVAQQQAFINSNLPLASTIAGQLGLSPSEVLGQWALETGWGTQSNYSTLNNPGNVSPGGQLATYPTMQAGAQAYANVLQSMGVTGLGNPQQFATALEAKGYAGANQQYAQSLVQTIGQVQTMAPGTTAPAYNPGGGFWSWLRSRIGDVGIIVLGGALVLGTLLVVSKETTINLGAK